MFVRLIRVRGHTYYMLVRSERRGKRVHQIVVEYYGKDPPRPVERKTVDEGENEADQ